MNTQVGTDQECNSHGGQSVSGECLNLCIPITVSTKNTYYYAYTFVGEKMQMLLMETELHLVKL